MKVMVSGVWVRPAEIPALLDRTYTRDSDGKFASGSGVRDSLANAKGIDEINAAAASEARRITGRDVSFDFGGSDPQVAREHAEGVLQTLEHFPRADLAHVGTYGAGSTPNPLARGLEHSQANAYAVAVGSAVYFNNRHGANPAGYRADLSHEPPIRSQIARDPRGVAIHEMGHVVVAHRNRPIYDDAVERADQAGMTPRLYITGHVSSYGSTAMSEYAAEAFTDVMVNGSDASALSQSAFSLIEGAYSSS